MSDLAEAQAQVLSLQRAPDKTPSPITMYQQSVSQSSKHDSLSQASVPFQPTKSMSKFRRLNYNSEGDTFCASSLSSDSQNTQYCPLEEALPTASSSPIEKLPSPNVEAQCTSASIGYSCEDSLVPPDLHRVEEECLLPITVTLGVDLPFHRHYDDTSKKNVTDIRIMGQNSRGVFPTGTPTSEFFEPSMESFKQMSADVVCLSKTNTDWKVRDNYWTAQLLNKAIWKPSPTKTTVSSCIWENRDRKSFQTGGVLTTLFNSLPSRILKSTGDKFGRWTRTHVQIKQNNLVLYNVYRTHAKTLDSAGIQTPWMMQWTAMRKGAKDDVDPRRQHMLDLMALVDEDVSKGDVSLIIGDFNEDLRDKEKEGLEMLESNPHVVNAFMHFNGQVPSSRLNNRSIYHIYVSKKLLPYVSKLGISTEHDGFEKSDHIPFFVDLSSKLFSTNLNAITPKHTRILQMYDKITVEKYVQMALRRMRSQNIETRIKRLQEYIRESGFTKEAICTLENLDTQITSIRLSSEKALLRKPTRYKSTDIAKSQVQKIRLLESLCRKHKKLQCCQSTINRLQEFEILYEINADNLDQVITQERQELKQIQEDIDVHRKDHLNRIHERSAAANNKELAQVVQEMKNREKQKKAWAKISFVTKKRAGGVTRLGIPVGYEDAPLKEVCDLLQDPNATPEWTYITDPLKIEATLIEWQKLHYNQAVDTPFAAQDLYEKMNPNTISEEEIFDTLNDNKHINGLHEASQALFHELSQNLLPKIPEEALSITVKKFKSFKAPEKTSSSPSGLHMGHWKATATDSDLTAIIVAIMNMAIENSYTLKRWRNVIGVLLEKKGGISTDS